MSESNAGKLGIDSRGKTKLYTYFDKAVEMGVTRKNHIGTHWDQ